MQQQNPTSVVQLTRDEMITTSGGTADPITNLIKMLLGGGVVPAEPVAPVALQ